MTERLLVLAPLRIERRAARRGAPDADVRRVGVGPRSANRAAPALREGSNGPVAVVGFCGALVPSLEPGDVVLASELHAGDRTVRCADPTILAAALRDRGMRVHVGPIASTPRIVTGSSRRALAASGAIAVDMESAWLAAAAGRRPVVTLRVVVDTPGAELHRPLRTLRGGIRAYRTLVRACGVLHGWSAAADRRELLLAAPRASCAGVTRAIDTVRAALAACADPVYVRRQIVHNARVVAELERLGARFVEELDEVPDGATVIFSAHGVAPAVRRQAAERSLRVIDATCPLVSKVHAEARRFAAEDYDIVLVGHAGHEEVEGTIGEAPDRIQLVGSHEELDDLQVRDPAKVAYLTQTTLALDDTSAVVEALRSRFPELRGPPRSDICYATQNRQDAVRRIAGECELMLVVGSGNSSNSKRLVEVAERAGCPALLVDGHDEIPLEALIGRRRIGLTAGASAPEVLVQEVVRALTGLGETTVTERGIGEEDIHFKLPVELRAQGAARPARKELT